MRPYLFVFLLIGTAGWGQSGLPPEEEQIQVLLRKRVSRDRDTALGYLYDRCARHWIIGGIPQRADEPLRRLEAITKNYIWPYGEALLLYRKGHYQTILGDATKAKSYFLQAIPRLKQTEQTSTLLAAYTQMASSEIDRDLDDNSGIQIAVGYLLEGINLSLKTPQRLFYSALCYQLGRAHLALQNYPKALYYLNESWGESQRTGFKKMPYYHCLLFSVCYIHLGDKRYSETWKECQTYLPDLNNQELYNFYGTQAEIHRFRKTYDQLPTDGKQLMLYATNLRSPTKRLRAHQILYDAYKRLNQTDSALYQLETIRQLEDSTLRQRSKVLLAELQLKYNMKQKQAEVAQLTIENQRSQTRLLVGSLFVLLLLSGYVFYNNRQLRQKNHAILTAQLKGQTLERQRVAADLHDNLGTTLSALHWNLEAIDKSKLSAVEQAVYTTISQQVGQAYKDVRLLSHNLLPDELAKQGLAVALQNLVHKMNRNTSVLFHLTGVDHLPRFDQQTEFELYSICLELLNNTIKHAHATEGVVALNLINGVLHLTVSDNGGGLNGQRSDGRGLQNVAARVATLGGEWLVDKGISGGVVNRITVPVTTPGHTSSQT